MQVSISVASFVPKPFTPFQWEPQDTIEMLHQKQRHLKESVTSRKIKVSCHDVQTSFLEGVFARGDRRLGKVLECAWRKGCKFDSWMTSFILTSGRRRFRSAVEPAVLYQPPPLV